MTDTASSPFTTTKQAADILGVSQQRVRQLIQAGRLPGSVKRELTDAGISAWFVPLEAIEALRASRGQT